MITRNITDNLICLNFKEISHIVRRMYILIVRIEFFNFFFNNTKLSLLPYSLV